MNNQQTGQPKPGTQANTSLIRVDQVPKLPHLNDQEKARTRARVQQLWDMLNNASASDVQRRQAHQHLTVLSQQIMQAMRAYNEQKQSQQIRQQTSPPVVQRSQPSPAPVTMTSQNVSSTAPAAAAVAVPTPVPTVAAVPAPLPTPAPAAAQTPAGSQLSPEVQQQLDAYYFVLPPAMNQGTKPAEDWLTEARSRLGAALQRMQQAKTQKANFQRLAITKQQQGGLSSAEQSTFNEKIVQFNKFITESQTFLEKFREQQTQFRAQRAQASATPSGTPVSPATSSDVSEHPLPQSVPSSQPTPQPQMAQPTGASGANNQLSTQLNTSLGTPDVRASQNPSIAVNQAQPLTSPSTPVTPQSGVMPVGFNQQQRPPYTGSNTSAMLTAPGAISPAMGQPPPHQQQHPHQQQFPSQAPQPRPGFGPGSNPAVQRSSTDPALSALSGYVLDRNEDGSVLSKEKLRELITEVLGADSDGLTADAEDLCINFVDDFVDDLLSQGCKMAKMRGSNHLDVRDIQVVLERQYNIRIPGYSTDELRVARRPQPAAGWTQKTNAIQSSKQAP